MILKSSAYALTFYVHAYSTATMEILLLSKAILAIDTGSADSQIQYRSKENDFGVHNSSETIGYDIAQQTSHNKGNREGLSSLFLAVKVK